MPHICSSRLDCHTLPATTLRKVVAPIPSGQTGLDASRQAQFSASIVILCEAFCVLSHHPGATRPLVQTAGLEPATFSLLAKCSCLLSYVCECPLWATSSWNPGREVRGGLCLTGIAPGCQGQVPVAGDELLLQAAAYILRKDRDASPEMLPAMAQTVGAVPNSPRDRPRLGRLHIDAGLSRRSCRSDSPRIPSR